VKRNVANTRERIMESAARMFEAEGVRAATVDGIAAGAGVTKRTLYYHFRSKDDLIAASLNEQDLVEQRAIDFVREAGDGSIEELLASVFSNIIRNASNARWKGCAFSRTAVELAGLPGHPAVSAAKKHRAKVERIFSDRLEAIGARDAARSARRLMILIDGAITHCLVHHDPNYAVEAREMALELVAAAKTGSRSRICLLDGSVNSEAGPSIVYDVCRGMGLNRVRAG